MKLYRISQDVNANYDTYDSAVVAAETAELAQQINPAGDTRWANEWAKPEHVKVELIGTAIKGTERGVIVASFNAS